MAAPAPPDPPPAAPANQLPAGEAYAVQVGRRALWLATGLLIVFMVGVGVLVSLVAERAGSVNSGAALAATKTTGTARVIAAATATATPVQTPTPDGVIKVYIIGEVRQPGVYQMNNGDRVIDAVRVAGGFTGAADQTRVDQAARVRDEMRIEIPRRPDTPLPPLTAGQAAPVITALPPTATPGDSRININTASVAELDRLPGIGAVLSQRLVDYRVKHGPFRSLNDLRKVEGITNSIIEKIKDLIVF